jgi:uncharacterized protein YndB with AHSA1/START domain
MKKAITIALAALCLYACNDDKKTEATTPGNNSTPTIKSADSAGTQDIVITRNFDAPVSEVWKAWTDPKRVVLWWGPKFYSSCDSKIDLREGGRFVFCMRSPKEEGSKEMYTSGVYSKIVPMALLEFGQALSDKDGNPIDPAQLNMPADFPKEIRTTLAFKSIGDKTELTVTEYDWKTGQMRDYSEMGMKQCLDKLDSVLVKR